ncbi:hypothetical protein [Viscerimonas tarda]
MKNFSITVTNEIPPFGRNGSPVSGLRDEETAASPPLPHPLSPKRRPSFRPKGGISCSYQQLYRKAFSLNLTAKP